MKKYMQATFSYRTVTYFEGIKLYSHLYYLALHSKCSKLSRKGKLKPFINHNIWPIFDSWVSDHYTMIANLWWTYHSKTLLLLLDNCLFYKQEWSMITNDDNFLCSDSSIIVAIIMQMMWCELFLNANDVVTI